MRLLPGSLLHRYVLRQLLWGLLASTVALVALMWLVQSLRFVELVVNRGLSLWVFLNLTGLLVPQLIAFVLPVTTFAVVQAVYQRMATDRELTVMRGTGLSPLSLGGPGIVLGLGALVLGAVLSNWLVPLSYGKFREEQFEIRNRMAAYLLEDGVFTQMSDGLTVFVRRRDADGELHGVLIDDARNPASEATIFAERGVIADGTDGPRVLLLHGSRQQIDHKTGRLDVLSFEQELIDLGEGPKADETRARDPDELSMSELLNPAPGSVAPQVAPKLLVEAHRRLASPFSSLSFALVALASVLTGAFSRHASYLRPTIAILSVVGILALQLAAQNIAGHNEGLLPLIWIAAIAPGVVAGVILFAPQPSGPRPYAQRHRRLKAGGRV
jgi:lipopolysaccharide export system permease protein